MVESLRDLIVTIGMRQKSYNYDSKGLKLVKSNFELNEGIQVLYIRGSSVCCAICTCKLCLIFHDKYVYFR